MDSINSCVKKSQSYSLDCSFMVKTLANSANHTQTSLTVKPKAPIIRVDEEVSFNYQFRMSSYFNSALETMQENR